MDDNNLTVILPSLSIIKQDSVSFPVLGPNNIFDKARNELNEIDKILLFRSRKVNINSKEMITHTLNKKMNEEKKRDFIMMKTLHLIQMNKPFLNSVERVEVIKKELNAIKVKTVFLANSVDKERNVMKKMILNKRCKRMIISCSPNKQSLTERSDNINNNNSNNYSYYVFDNKRLGVIDLLNNFDNRKDFFKNNITENNNIHYKGSNVTHPKTNSGLKIKFRRILFSKENEFNKTDK